MTRLMLGVALTVATFPWALARAEASPACFGRVATIVGTPGRDGLEGTSGPDVIVGLGGADDINGRGGDDWICLEKDGASYTRADPEPAAFIDGRGGADRIRGGRGADSLTGGDGKDIIHGDHRGSGDEFGEDFLGGDAGRDVLFGGGDGDFARGGRGRDLIYLGPGDDNGTGLGGNDVIFGGQGADEIGGRSLQSLYVDGLTYHFTTGLGEQGDDSFFGGKGNDWFGLGRGRDEMSGGAGSDGIVIRTEGTSSFEADLRAGRAVGGGSATDRLASVQNAFAYGPSDIRIVGNKFNNRLFASSSSTESTVRIEGRGGDDSIRIYPVGPPGRTPLRGTGQLFGDGGNDRMWAGCGKATDVLSGGQGDDMLTACAGSEQLFGRSGDDVLRGATEDSQDLFDGGEGKDLISYRVAHRPASVDLGSGEASSCKSSSCDASVLLSIEDAEGTWFEDDNLTGDEGNNDLYGLWGNDVLSGMAGDDRLSGSEDDDFLDGGEGTNLNDGGEGADSCLRPSSAEGATDCEVPT